MRKFCLLCNALGDREVTCRECAEKISQLELKDQLILKAILRLHEDLMLQCEILGDIRSDTHNL